MRAPNCATGPCETIFNRSGMGSKRSMWECGGLTLQRQRDARDQTGESWAFKRFGAGAIGDAPSINRLTVSEALAGPGEAGDAGVECLNVAGAGAVCGSEHLSLEVCGGGIRAGVAGAICISDVAAAGERRPVRDDQCGFPLFRWILRDRDFLETAEGLPAESVHPGAGIVAGECADRLSDAW